MTPAEFLVIVGVGTLAGVLAGVFGVGGGVLLVPAMVIVLGYGQHLAQGTSLLVIIPTAIAGTLANRRSGLIDARQALAVAVGGMVGAVIGGRFALVLDDRSLRLLFVVYLLIIGFRLLLPPGWRSKVGRLHGRDQTDR
jgi:uncharacterized protein